VGLLAPDRSSLSVCRGVGDVQTRDALGGPIDDSLGEWRDQPDRAYGMLGARGGGDAGCMRLPVCGR
jgi:hypothetical protein